MKVFSMVSSSKCISYIGSKSRKCDVSPDKDLYEFTLKQNIFMLNEPIYSTFKTNLNQGSFHTDKLEL